MAERILVDQSGQISDEENDPGDSWRPSWQSWNPGYHDWTAGISATQLYCDTMYHTRFYPKNNPVEVQVVIYTVTYTGRGSVLDPH